MASATSVLTPEHDLFAANVASGLSYRKSAKLAGFSPDHAFRILRIPEVRERIAELAAEPDEKLRARVNAEFTILLNRVSSGEPMPKDYDPDRHLRVLMGLARYKGWVIEKKQVDKRSLTASVKVGRAELEAITADLERLAPGATGQLERLGRPALSSDLKAIASGDLIESEATKSVTTK